MGDKNDGAPAGKRPTKKDQILALAATGISEVTDLALLTNSRPAYVANVLQESGQAKGYFDLYTSAGQPMNVYSKFFAGKLGFRDEETSRASVEHIDKMYRQFALTGDRAGQHHALVMALMMFDRARWTNKQREAEPFRRWLLERLSDGEPAAAPVRSSKRSEKSPVAERRATLAYQENYPRCRALFR